ncbi:4-dimethylallyltryptophan n-methyltransferase [Fusarium globosum]|uniref:4-dimethylallyltryptophan n-methyltransferase n=1 Tax=Fusarium globosum TaxID=78864 RepID=A0A8H5XQA6_9HYPO|nr:4-dimethylallyltryptophan n-methyltransferase [Fusarium globosum]
MSPLYTKAWAPAHKEIIDIGGSTLDTTFDTQLPGAFKGEGYFPKEVDYITGMHHWCEIADTSYQTTDELSIIKSTASDVVKDIPATGAVIIDLGAANSRKFVPYVQAFIKQGKPCIYIALDLCKESLTNHINKSAADFPQITCIGLWGNFIQGDKLDDGPSGTEASSAHAAYQTKAYDAFFISYLQGIQTHADIDANPRISWTYESKLDNSMHYFKVVAQHDMVCHRYNDFFIQKGTVYTMFPSWKRGEAEIHAIAKAQGLDVKTLGKAQHSGMRQYLIQPRI